jgi:hypothetical protein
VPATALVRRQVTAGSLGDDDLRQGQAEGRDRGQNAHTPMLSDHRPLVLLAVIAGHGLVATPLQAQDVLTSQHTIEVTWHLHKID